MAAIAVNVRRKAAGPQTLDLEGDLQRARWLANLLDAEFSVGGIRFGLDAIVGLVPVVGATVSFVAGMYPIFIARKHGLGKTLEWRMWGNLLVDYFGGMVPLVGDAFDVAFKANLKNYDLLENAAAKKKGAR